MATPLRINFDYRAGEPKADGIVHLDAIFQGTPYLATLQLQTDDNDPYSLRAFNTYSEIVCQIRSVQGGDVLLELRKTTGEIVATADTFGYQFAGSRTDGITFSDADRPGIQTLAIVHDTRFYVSGVEVEQFAAGTGVIVRATTDVTP